MRSALLHVCPPIFHLIYRAAYKKELEEAYLGLTSVSCKFWTSVGGYFAMGLIWEHVFPPTS